MTIEEAINNLSIIAFDTAPLIYYIEDDSAYADMIQVIVDKLDKNMMSAVGSTLLLTELLTQPKRRNDQELVEQYTALLEAANNFRLVSLDSTIAIRAAELRAQYNLKTPDALHVATALISDAEAFLTNDQGIKRVKELKVIVLSDLTI